MTIARPLRFCMITTFYPPYSFGGDGIFVHRLSNELARRGHQVEVIHSIEAYRLRAGNDGPLAYDDHPNVTVHGLASRLGFVSSLATQQTGVPLFHAAAIKRILSKGFDVIHYHNVSLVGGPQVLRYGRGIKLYTMHEYWLVCPTHVLFRYNRALCVQPHCFLCSVSYRRPPQWWRYTGFLNSAVKQVDRFIAPTRFAKEIQARMGLDVPAVVLPNFAPAVELVNADLPGDPVSTQPYFLFVGRLEKVKGLQTLIPVFRDYGKANLLIAGAGSYEPQLRRLAAGHPNIGFLGATSQDKLQSLYRRAVAVIVPSLCYEAFPLVMLESYRQQTPTIVRNQGGMPEITTESGGGIVYKTDQELIEAMEQLISDPSSRTAMGRRGYTAYQKKWTTEAHLERYFEIIHQIAGTRDKRSE